MIPKFRAWDKSNKKMCDVKAWSEFNGGEVTIKRDGENASYVVPLDDIILMQSTGLKDKNGVEVFEGDVVIAWSQGVKGTFEIKRRIDGLWLLYPAWKDGQFWYLSPTEDGCETIEIIGNIYELESVKNEK